MDLCCDGRKIRGTTGDFCTQSLQVKKCRDNLGAALRRRGIKDALDAMVEDVVLSRLLWVSPV